MVVLNFPDLRVVEEKTVMVTTSFPYVPGFLTFREDPALTAAFENLVTVPDVVVFDGQG